jgi:hypothetical protein|eukprot:COSAG02_NODE_3303_length_6979_cov_14.734884_4_plen_71_part_00
MGLCNGEQRPQNITAMHIIVIHCFRPLDLDLPTPSFAPIFFAPTASASVASLRTFVFCAETRSVFGSLVR